MPLIKYTMPVIPSQVFAEAQNVQPLPANEAPKAAEPKYTGRKAASSDTMSKEEWAAKDRRIGRAGLYQAALQSTGLMQYAPTLDEYFALVRRAAEAGLKFVAEGQ